MGGWWIGTKYPERLFTGATMEEKLDQVVL